jgi:hypothetical protein
MNQQFHLNPSLEVQSNFAALPGRAQAFSIARKRIPAARSFYAKPVELGRKADWQQQF